MRIRTIAAVAVFGLVGALGVAGCAGSGGAGADSKAQSAPKAAGQADASAGKPEAPAAEAKRGQQPMSAQERHVMRTAWLTLRVDDVTGSAAKARDVAERFGGFVANERTEKDNASLTLRVAADRLNEALNALDELGEVTQREQQADDVTEQAVDVQTRIANQQASVDRVRALLQRATGIDEVVKIESELTKRQAELESLEKRAATLASQTELATVTVSLAKPQRPAVLSEEKSGFQAGFAAGWRAFIAAVTVFVTVLGAVLPFLTALAIPALVTLLIFRHRRAAARPSPTSAPTASSTGS